MDSKDICILILICAVIILLVSIVVANLTALMLEHKMRECRSDRAFLSDIIDRKFDEINSLKEKLNSTHGCACGWVPNNYTYIRPNYMPYISCLKSPSGGVQCDYFNITPIEPFIMHNFTVPGNYTLRHLKTINLTDYFLRGDCNISDPMSPCM